MNVLIVDDSIDKLSEVSKILVAADLNIKINTVEDIQGAMFFLKENSVDLLILDQFLPLIKGKDQKILKDGGYQLINEINRKADKIITPKYIIGLSQYYNECEDFSDIWKLVEYSPSHTKWCNPLIKILKHISNIKDVASNVNYNIMTLPTIYVEGLTDLSLLNYVATHYFSEVKDKFSIESQRNAGANWVAQQLVIWGHKLKRNNENKLIKAIGLFDLDEAGVKAKNDALKKLNSSNQMEAVKVFAIQAKHNKNLIEFFKRGLQIEIEIESLMPVDILNYADKKGWLEYRTPLFIDPPKDWNQMNETVSAYLDKIKFPNELKVYLKKVKITNKEQFTEYVINRASESITVLDNLKLMLNELINILLSSKE